MYIFLLFSTLPKTGRETSRQAKLYRNNANVASADTPLLRMNPQAIRSLSLRSFKGKKKNQILQHVRTYIFMLTYSLFYFIFKKKKYISRTDDSERSHCIMLSYQLIRSDIHAA